MVAIVDFKPAELFRGTRILRRPDNLAYAYVTSHAAADADGAPNAYHPGDVGKNCIRDPHIGLDCPENAGFPEADWWPDVLVTDPDDSDTPFVQPHGPFAGFFVSMTSLQAPGGSRVDPATYVDSTRMPYVVIPSGFGATVAHGARQGDVGIATHVASGRSTAFIVADSGGGSDAKLGEASIALFAALGFANANPRTGANLPRDDIQYVLFPGSHRQGHAIWPRTLADIAAQVDQLLADIFGTEPDV